MRAVKLYSYLGKRVSATTRQLGYPAENALNGWCREYEHRLDLPKSYARARSARVNLVNRGFQAAATNEKWRTDIIEFQIPAEPTLTHTGRRPDADLRRPLCLANASSPPADAPAGLAGRSE